MNMLKLRRYIIVYTVVGLCGKNVVEMNAIIGKNYPNKRMGQPIIEIVV